MIESKDVEQIHNNSKSTSNILVVLDIILLIIALSTEGENGTMYLFYVGIALFGMSEYINKKYLHLFQGLYILY